MKKKKKKKTLREGEGGGGSFLLSASFRAELTLRRKKMKLFYSVGFSPQ